MYRCVASNPAGSATAAATLSVTGKESVKLVVKVRANQKSSFKNVSLALVGFTDVNLGTLPSLEGKKTG